MISCWFKQIFISQLVHKVKTYVEEPLAGFGVGAAWQEEGGAEK